MPDMYDKLGDLLNEALTSGKIPQNEKIPDDRNIPDEKSEYSGHFNLTEEEKAAEINRVNEQKVSKNAKNSEKNGKTQEKLLRKREKEQFPRGQVIKLHKYTYNMQFPPLIQKALTTLDIAYPFTIKSIQKQYHKLLKENHPDTQNTIQSSKDVQNTRHKSIDELAFAYKILSEYFSLK
ncbi:MAG: hypothetical protein K6A43_10500 [Treponema sp.]|nr:hypothetical protein [Treponema sp.]